MKKFEVCIKGKNFLVKKDEEAKKHGFYAARGVEAKDTTDAVDVAMGLIRAELKKDVLNDESDPPIMCLEELCQVYSLEDSMEMEVGEKKYPTKGFVWHDE
jgi:hypothetical protein